MRGGSGASEREKRARGEMMSVARATLEASLAGRATQQPGERYRPCGDNAVYTPRGSGCSRPRRPSSPRPVTRRPSRYRPPTAAWQPSLGELRAPPPGARAGCSALQAGGRGGRGARGRPGGGGQGEGPQRGRVACVSLSLPKIYVCLCLQRWDRRRARVRRAESRARSRASGSSQLSATACLMAWGRAAQQDSQKGAPGLAGEATQACARQKIATAPLQVADCYSPSSAGLQGSQVGRG